MPVPPAIIDYGTDDDAGFWKDALRFAPFRIEDFRAGVPCPSTARRRDEAGNTPARLVPAASFPPLIHAEPTATRGQRNYAGR